MTDETTPVTADAPVAEQGDEGKPKERKQRTPKDPYDFGAPSEGTPGFKLPAELPQDKGGLRAIADKFGVLPRKAISYLTAREAHAALREDYPFQTKPGAYGYNPPEDMVEVKNLDELLQIAGHRKKAYTEAERVRSAEREAMRREALGDRVDKFSGRDEKSRREFLADTLGPKAPWVPVGEPKRADQRVYDIDGVAGRRTFYDIVPKAQLKQDGTPRADATVVKMSPQVFEQLIRGDKDLEALLEVPEGFNVAPKKERKPKADGEAKPKRQRKSTKEMLASADAAAGMPAEDVDDAIGGPAQPTAPTPDVPVL